MVLGGVRLKRNKAKKSKPKRARGIIISFIVSEVGQVLITLFHKSTGGSSSGESLGKLFA
jgi:hypothetical protein